MTEEKIKNKDGINEGTKIKARLQLRALEFMEKYDIGQTLEAYAELLCWDINTTKRTALDSYVLPMMRHGYFIYEGDDKFTFIKTPQTQQQKVTLKLKVKEKELKEPEKEYMNYVMTLKEGDKKLSYDDWLKSKEEKK